NAGLKLLGIGPPIGDEGAAPGMAPGPPGAVCVTSGGVGRLFKAAPLSMAGAATAPRLPAFCVTARPLPPPRVGRALRAANCWVIGFDGCGGSPAVGTPAPGRPAGPPGALIAS